MALFNAYSVILSVSPAKMQPIFVPPAIRIVHFSTIAAFLVQAGIILSLAFANSAATVVQPVLEHPQPVLPVHLVYIIINRLVFPHVLLPTVTY